MVSMGFGCFDDFRCLLVKAEHNLLVRLSLIAKHGDLKQREYNCKSNGESEANRRCLGSHGGFKNKISQKLFTGVHQGSVHWRSTVWSTCVQLFTFEKVRVNLEILQIVPAETSQANITKMRNLTAKYRSSAGSSLGCPCRSRTSGSH